MIRVNLLKNRRGQAGRIDTALGPVGKNVFVSPKELLLGGAFLLLGSLILFTQFRKFEPPSFSDERSLGSFAGVAEQQRSVEPPPADVRDVQPPPQPVEFQNTLEAPTETPEVAAADAVPNGESMGLAGPVLPSEASGPEPEEMVVAPGTGRLRQLFISVMGDAVRVFAGTGMVPAYQSFQLENPNRIVIDLSDVVVDLPADKLDQTVDHPQVQRVRAAQHQIDPPITRLVLDVSTYPNVEFFPQFNGLYVRVSGADGSAAGVPQQ